MVSRTRAFGLEVAINWVESRAGGQEQEPSANFPGPGVFAGGGGCRGQ